MSIRQNMARGNNQHIKRPQVFKKFPYHQHAVQEHEPIRGRELAAKPPGVSRLESHLQPVLVARRVVPLLDIPDVDALVLRLDRDHLPFVGDLERARHPGGQVGLAVEVVCQPRVLGAESAELVAPERHRLEHAALVIGVGAGYPEERLDGRQRRQEGLLARREHVECDDALVGPRVERDVALEEHAHARHAGRVEAVAVVAEHRETRGRHAPLHGGREACLAVEEVGLEVPNVDEQVLTGRVRLVAVLPVLV